MARGSKKDKGKVERIPEAAWNAGIYARLSVDYHNQKSHIPLTGYMPDVNPVNNII